LSVVGSHDSFGNINLRHVGPEHRGLRIGNVEDHGIAIFLGVLIERAHELFADAGSDFVLLALKIVLGSFRILLQRALLLLNVLDQRGMSVFVHLVALRLELLLHVLNFGVGLAELRLLRLVFLVQRVKIALAFAGRENCPLDINDSDLGWRRGGWRG